MKYWMVLFGGFLFMGFNPVNAGERCPIDYGFHDLGVPEWLDKTTVLGKLTSRASWLGITYRNPHEGEADTGVVISELPNNSPAQRAGIRVGDVLVRIGKDGKVTGRDSVDVLLSKMKHKKIIEFGVLRGSELKTLTVQPELYDPLLRRLIIVNDAEDECANTHLELLPERIQAQLHKAVLSPKRSFYCKDAHQRILKHPSIEQGDIVYIRGSWRVLISVAGFDTVCVKSADYDGAKLTNARVQRLFEQFTADYTNDRFERP